MVSSQQGVMREKRPARVPDAYAVLQAIEADLGQPDFAEFPSVPAWPT